MPRISTILLPTDFSPASRVTAQYAAALARHFKAKMTLLNVMPPPNLSMEALGTRFDDVLDTQRSLTQTRLDSFMADELKYDEVKRVLVNGDPASTIVHFAHSESFDLIMMATRGCGPFRHFVLGSVTAKVLHDTHLPVWTGVHVEEMKGSPTVFIRSIICAVNDEVDNVDALRWASDLAHEFKANLVLAHALPSFRFDPETYYLESDLETELRKASAGEAKGRLSEMAQRCGVPDAAIYIEGGAVSKVVRLAVENNNADLVVIGRSMQTGALGRLRATSYSIINQSPCPIISV